MYIGSTDTRGLMHCLWEIIDNAVDEALGGFGREIDVTLRGRRRHHRARPRPRHPGRHRAADRSVRGRGRLHQAARRRQVRRGVVQRDRRPARRRRLGGERAVQPAGRRGRPQRGDLRDVVPARRAGHLRRSRTDAPGSPRAASSAKVGRAPQGRDRHPDHLLAGPADLPARRPAVADRPAGPRPADQLPGARAWPSRWSTPAPPRSTQETFRHDGGISEFCEFLAADDGDHRGDPAARPGLGSPRPCRCWTTTGTWSRPTSTATSTSTSRCAGATATTPRSSRTSTSSPRRRAAPTSPGSSAR